MAILIQSMMYTVPGGCPNDTCFSLGSILTYRGDDPSFKDGEIVVVGYREDKEWYTVEHIRFSEARRCE